MLDAEHLTIIDVCLTAFAPGNDVVRVHFLEFVLCLFASFSGTDGANALLTFIDQTFGSTVISLRYFFAKIAFFCLILHLSASNLTK